MTARSRASSRMCRSAREVSERGLELGDGAGERIVIAATDRRIDELAERKHESLLEHRASVLDSRGLEALLRTDREAANEREQVRRGDPAAGELADREEIEDPFRRK